MADDIQSNIRINVDTASAMDSIRLLQNQISAFHTQMSKMGAATSADARNLQQNLINSINSTGAFTANMTKVRTTAEQFSQSLERNKLTMGEYFRYAGGASKTFGRAFKAEFETINKVARERVKDLQSQYIKLGRDANGAMQAIRVRPLVLDMDNLGTKTQIAAQRQQLLNQLLKQGSTNLLNFGKNTQWAGRQLMVGFTIPLGIMGSAAMKSYKEIEEAGIRLRRVYGDFGTTNVETEKMVKDIQRLALEYTKYGVAVKDSMQMAADAAAMGKKGADLLAQVSSSARLAVLGGVDQQMALKTTTSLTDAFGVSTKQLAKDIDFLNAVENQTVLSIEDMTIAIPKAAPVIQQLGGDVKDLAFFLTAMKEGGINASESANALKSGLASLINPTNTASKMLQGFGINLREIVQGNKGDVKKTVIDFAQALDKLDPLNRAKAIEQLFGKFQFARLSTLFKNVIEQGSQASQVLNLASASSLELSMLAQRELNKVEASPLFKFQKSIADFQAALAPVGEQFMKALTPIISFGTDVLNNFNNLNEGVKGFIVKFVAVAGVVGPVLLMSFGLIANAVANVIKGFALMKDIFNKTGKSSLSLGEQVNYMTNEQIQAAAIASSLDQVHSKLKQTFTSEAAAVDMLTAAYQRSVAAQKGFAVPIAPRGPMSQGPVRKYAAGGIIRGPGTGTSDSILAMVSNGEAIIPAASVARNPDMVKQLVSGNIPGFNEGTQSVDTSVITGEMKKGIGLYKAPSAIVTQSKRMVWDTMQAEKDAVEQSVRGLLGNSQKAIDKINNLVIKQASHIMPDTVSTDVAGQSVAIKRWSAGNLVADLGYVNNFLNAAGNSTEFLDDFEKTKLPDVAKKLGVSLDDARIELDNVRHGLHPITAKSARFVKELGIAAQDFSIANPKKYGNLGYQGAAVSAGLGQRLSGNFYSTLADRAYDPGKDLRAAEQVQRRVSRLETLVLQARTQGTSSAQAFVNAQNAVLNKPQNDPYVQTRNRNSPHSQAPLDGKDDGVAYSQARAVAIEKEQGRIAGRGGRRVSQEQMAPHSVTGDLVPLSMVNAPLYGPQEGTRLQKLKAGMNAGSIYRNLQSADPEKLAGSIRNRSFGAAGGLAVGSMLVPGEMGQMMGMASMLTSFGGMGAGSIAKGMKSLSKETIGLGLKFLKFVPYVGAAVVAFEAFDSFIMPLIKKNSKAYEAIAETLSITQNKLDKINNFFGTELKLTGVRSTVIASGDQTKEEASIAQKFQQSQEFKDLYQASAQEMQKLTNAEFRTAMQAMSADLFGQGMEAEGVTAIIDAIAIEAKKTRVSIAPELFSIANPETKALMQKNLKSIFAQVSEGAKGVSPEGTFDPTGRTLEAASGAFDNTYLTPVDPESIAKIKAGTEQIASYMSALSGQFANGEISAKEFSLEYSKLLSIARQQPGTSGLEAMKAAMISLNAEIGHAIKGLDSLNFPIWQRAIIAGVTPTEEALDAAAYGGKEIVDAYTKNFEEAEAQLILNRSKEQKLKKQINDISSSSSGIANTEQKVNDKYNKRIEQLEKIKTLNEQLAKSQQGQLTLAEALNKGDIAAAARAAVDIQNNDIQTSLDNQKAGLEEARKAELEPLKGAQAANTTAVNKLTEEISELNTTGVVVKNPEGETGPIALSKQGNDPMGYVNYAGTIASFANIGTALGTWLPKLLSGDFKGIFQSLLAPGTALTQDGRIVPQRMKNPKPEEKAAGGFIRGPGSGTSDDIPAMLSNGEYVIRANAVKTIGIDTLDKLNQADRLGFAAGGMVRAYRNGGMARGYNNGGFVSDSGWYDASPNLPVDKKGNRLNVFNNDGGFLSAKAAETYYTGLIRSRRFGVSVIEQSYQKNLEDKWMTQKESNNLRINNLINNRTYGKFNGLDQEEAKTFSLALSKLYGKKGMESRWSKLGFDKSLLSKKPIAVGKREKSWWELQDKFLPKLSVNAPKFAMGGLVGYKDGGKAKNWDLKDPSAPWNQGDFKKFNDYQTRKQYWAMGQPGSREIVDAGKTAGYFLPGIGSGLAFGDAGTAFGKGDVGGGLLNTAFGFGAMWIPKAIGMIGKGLGQAADFVKTGLGIRAGKNALKAAASFTGASVSKVGELAPRLGFNLSDAALQNMVKDNFYGNMRVPGIRSSTKDSMMNRIAVEKNMMGIPANAPASKTPAYGFLTTKEDVPSYYNSIMGGMGPRSKSQEGIDYFNLLVNPMSRYTNFYGSNTIKLKPDALGKATISMGDSLSIWDKAISLGEKIPKVNKLSSIFSTFPALSGKLGATQNMMRKDVPGKTNATRFPYIEAHLPGGFTVKDIESIILNPTGKFGPQAPEKIAADLAERKAALEALFESMGIKGIKITENGGIKIGNKVLDGKYPLPTRAPKPPIKNPFAGMLSNLKKKPKPITYDTMFGPKTRGQGFDELNVDGAARERGGADLLTSEELHYLTEYVARPGTLHGATFAYAKNEVVNAILRNKFKIDKGTEILRVANVHDMNLFKDMKPGQARILDQFLSVANKNHPSTKNFLEDMISGKIDTGGRGSGSYPLIKFNVKTDIPGINDINNIKSGLSDVSDGLLAPGTSMKLVKVTSSNGQLTYHVDLGTNIKAKYGFNQKGTADYYKNLSDSLPAGHKYKQDMLQTALELITKPIDNSRMLDFIRSQGGKYANGGMVRKYANGGMVMPIAEPAPKQFANGGLAMGTDTVPAMLTPGEFVIKKSAVDRIGPSTLNKINRFAEGGLVGGMPAVAGESVYNSNTYEINVNVSSNSNPDQIADTVMAKIRQIDNKRVRGSAF